MLPEVTKQGKHYTNVNTYVQHVYEDSQRNYASRIQQLKGQHLKSVQLQVRYLLCCKEPNLATVFPAL